MADEGKKPANGRLGTAVKLLIIFAALAGGGLWGTQWLSHRMAHVFENDARIAASVISVSSRVAGWVTKITVIEGDPIRAGHILVQVDDRDSRLRLSEMGTRIDEIKAEQSRVRTEIEMSHQQTRRRHEAQDFRVSAARAKLQAAGTQLKLAGSEHARVKSLVERKVLSRQRWDRAQADLREAQEKEREAAADLAVAKAVLLDAKAARGQTTVLRKRLDQLLSEQTRLATQLQRQSLDLKDRTILSPTEGVVDATFVNEGEYVRPGQRLMLIHDPSQIWIAANIRETELRHVKIGAPVKITVDAFPDREFKGEVFRIGNTTTSEFSLLPNPNPSGNFTKITQRLPVRIKVDQDGASLRPGMMVEIDIVIPGRE